MKERLLIKLGRGIFAKTNPSLLGNKTILAKDFPSVAREALDKLKIRTYPTKAELDYNSGISTQIPTGLMVAVNKRVAERFLIMEEALNMNVPSKEVIKEIAQELSVNPSFIGFKDKRSRYEDFAN